MLTQSSKSKRYMTFRSTWKKEQHVNADGIEETFDWVQSVPNDATKAKCTLCLNSKPFSISSGGISDIKRHANGNGHRKLIKDRTSQLKLFGTKELSLGVSDADKVARAETLQALKVVDSNQSFASTNGDGDMFRVMFDDSEIAAKYNQGETKTKYTIQFGIAPHIKNELLKDFVRSPFSFSFDESTTSKVQKQYDGYITYVSKKSGYHVVTTYVGSLFVGHCTAEDLIDHFFDFIKELNLDTDYLMNVGMDGPSVNLKFEKELKKKLEAEKGNSFLQVGSCILHIVNNGFGEGLKIIKSFLDIEQLLIDLYFFFKLSAARREDYKNSKEFTELMPKLMLKYCSTRWLYIGKCALRVIEQSANLKMYFLNVLPTMKGFKGKRGVGMTERYKRIKLMLEDEMLLPSLTFVVFASTIFKPFVALFQKNQPMIHLAHPQMLKLVNGLLIKFVAPEKVEFLKKDVNELLHFDISKEGDEFMVKPEMGTKTSSLLDEVKDQLRKKRFVTEVVVGFYTATTQYLINNLPIDKQLLKDIQYINPMLRKKKIEKPLLRVVGDVAKCLGEKFREVFGVDVGVSVDDLKDMIKNEISFYRMESIPESFYLNKKKSEEKSNRNTAVSYWKYAYNVCDIDMEEMNTSENDKYRRIDSYWIDVYNIEDEEGNQKYGKLAKLALTINVLAVANPAPERGFSINKNILQAHGSSLENETIIALRLVKDHILRCGGVMSIKIDKYLIKSVRYAYQKGILHF